MYNQKKSRVWQQINLCFKIGSLYCTGPVIPQLSLWTRLSLEFTELYLLYLVGKHSTTELPTFPSLGLGS